ncbi:MAG: hypothetical protein ACREBU_07415 [Nitrososphaera sp.]
MSGGGSKVPERTTQTTVSQPPAYLEPYLREAAGGAAGLYQGYRPQIWGGPDVIPLTAEEQAVRQAAARAAGGPMQALAGQGAQAAQFGLSGDVLRPESNPYLRAMGRQMIDPMIAATMESARGLQSQAIAQGAYGGSREALMGAGAISGLQRNIGNALANLYGGAYGQGLGFMGQSMGMMPQIQQAQLAGPQALAGLAAQSRAIQEEQLGAQRARFQEQQEYPYQLLARYISALSGNPAAGFGTQMGTQIAQGGRGSPLTSALGSAAGGGMMGGALAGAQAGGMSGPWGAGLGALAGLLMGLM